MTQKLFDIGKGALLGGRVSILVGSGAPGLSDDTLNARPGSLYLDDLDGGSYRKVRTAAGTDKWELIGAGLSPKVVSGVQGLAVVDQSYATESAVVKWLVDVTRTNDPASRYLTEITALHDGSASADATRVDWNDYGVLHFGPAIDGLAIGVRLNGSGSAQVVELTVAAEVAVDVVVRRADLGLYLGAAEPLDISAAPHAATHTAGSTDPLAIDAAQVISGTFDIARVPVAGSVPWDGVADKPTTLAGYGISDAQPLDSTLSTLTAFSRALLDDADAQAGRATLGLGDAAVRSVGATSGTVCAGDDARLGNARTPLPHAATHASGSGDPLALDASQVTSGTFDVARVPFAGSVAWSGVSGKPTTLAGYGISDAQPLDSTLSALTAFSRALLDDADAQAGRATLGLGDAAVRSVGATSGTVCAGDDARLGNARTPLPHAATHASGGGDPLALDASQVTSGTFDVARVPFAGSVAWSGVSGKPTTLAGYGISDAQPYNANIQAHIGDTDNPHHTTAAQVGAMANSHAANSITGVGATPAALGIANAGTSTAVARADHVHPLPSAADVGALAVNHPAATISGLGTSGSQTTVARADHTHAQYLTVAPVTSVAGRTGAVTLVNTDISGLGTAATRNVGTGAGTVCAGDDARLGDARTPLFHAASHADGSSDPLTPAAIGAAAADHTHGEYQSASTTLTALAALVTTDFGRSLLELVDLAALQALVGGDSAMHYAMVFGSTTTLTLTESGTYRLSCVGGGGSGGAVRCPETQGGRATGGAGGGFAEVVVALNAGTTLSIGPGAGGAAVTVGGSGTGMSPGNAGGATTITWSGGELLAPGGPGGAAGLGIGTSTCASSALGSGGTLLRRGGTGGSAQYVSGTLLAASGGGAAGWPWNDGYGGGAAIAPGIPGTGGGGVGSPGAGVSGGGSRAGGVNALGFADPASFDGHAYTAAGGYGFSAQTDPLRRMSGGPGGEGGGGGIGAGAGVCGGGGGASSNNIAVTGGKGGPGGGGGGAAVASAAGHTVTAGAGGGGFAMVERLR